MDALLIMVHLVVVIDELSGAANMPQDGHWRGVPSIGESWTRKGLTSKGPNGISVLPVSYCVKIESVPWLMQRRKRESK
jgi:hypothetical protein